MCDSACDNRALLVETVSKKPVSPPSSFLLEYLFRLGKIRRFLASQYTLSHSGLFGWQQRNHLVFGLFCRYQHFSMQIQTVDNENTIRYSIEKTRARFFKRDTILRNANSISLENCARFQKKRRSILYDMRRIREKSGKKVYVG